MSWGHGGREEAPVDQGSQEETNSTPDFLSTSCVLRLVNTIPLLYKHVPEDSVTLSL